MDIFKIQGKNRIAGVFSGVRKILFNKKGMLSKDEGNFNLNGEFNEDLSKSQSETFHLNKACNTPGRRVYNIENFKETPEVKTLSGRHAVDVDDSVARELRGLGMREVYLKASGMLTFMGTDIDEYQLENKYSHLNMGMKRMAVGNLLRGAMRKYGISDLEELMTTK